ncbi:mCG68169 [Mus musculus]|nr:mCG68169 [Mus musculus]
MIILATEPEVQGQGHIDCRQILQHSLYGA